MVERLQLGVYLLALGVLAWVCVARHAPAIAAARMVSTLRSTSVAPTGPPPSAPEPAARPPAPTPEPPAAVRVQAELDRLLAEGRIDFQGRSDRLRAEATGVLDAVAEQLASAPELRIEVGGHTDGRGDPGVNRSLSQRRADSVKAYLVGRGIDPARVNTVGYGATRRINRAHTPEANQQNQRIELHVLAPGGR